MVGVYALLGSAKALIDAMANTEDAIGQINLERVQDG
jgi:hypothetical protein